MVGPLRGIDGDSGVPTTYVEDIDGGPPSPRGGLIPIQDSKGVL
jgi:hypothetical protein